jgi:hypothetical protein
VAATSDPIINAETKNVPAWPFLVANHELGRVDYRTLVAPDFLVDQECSQILTSLPLSMEEEGVHSCCVTYRTGSGETCKIVALYQFLPVPAEGYFPIRPQREVQVIAGLIFTLRAFSPCVTPELLKESFQLYDEEYRQFCRSHQPREFPVILSWPLAAPPASPLTVTTMPEQDATRLHPRLFAHRTARVNPQQRAERAFPISRAQIMEEITQETFFSRLRRFFHWHKSGRSPKQNKNLIS